MYVFLSHPLYFPHIHNSFAPRGSEVVFELYSSKAKSTTSTQYFLRVLWGGQPMETSTPLGKLDMIPVETFFECTSILKVGMDCLLNPGISRCGFDDRKWRGDSGSL
jgi:hypothetical protein